MHKNIAKTIFGMIKKSPYSEFNGGTLLSATMVTKRTGGFWRVYITFHNKDNAPSKSLYDSLHLIGQFFGEGLSISKSFEEIKNGDTIEVS